MASEPGQKLAHQLIGQGLFTACLQEYGFLQGLQRGSGGLHKLRFRFVGEIKVLATLD
jgi:hypothetical protein